MREEDSKREELKEARAWIEKEKKEQKAEKKKLRKNSHSTDWYYLIIESIPYVFCLVAAFVSLAVAYNAFFSPEALRKAAQEEQKRGVYGRDWSHAEDDENNAPHCSLFVNSCLVEEWSPVCLLTKCIIDTRK